MTQLKMHYEMAQREQRAAKAARQAARREVKAEKRAARREAVRGEPGTSIDGAPKTNMAGGATV